MREDRVRGSVIHAFIKRRNFSRQNIPLLLALDSAKNLTFEIQVRIVELTSKTSFRRSFLIFLT